jgi:hypothetical protein
MEPSETSICPLWGNMGLKVIHYRTLWWMIDMGAMRGALMRGWMNVCAGDLEVHRITLNRVVKRLVVCGFVRQLKKGTYELVETAFESEADAGRVRIVQKEAA